IHSIIGFLSRKILLTGGRESAVSMSQGEEMDAPESTNADPHAAPHADRVSKLNSDTLARFTNLVKTGPSANFSDYFRIEGDWYTRALRKLRPDDEIPNLGCAEGSKYIATKEPQSLKELLDRRPNRDALDELVFKINQ